MGEPSIIQLHELRITGKYLRYTLKSFLEVLPPEADALVKDVVNMQDALGELHDADVTMHLIRDYRLARVVGRKRSATPENPCRRALLLISRSDRIQCRAFMPASFAIGLRR